MDNFQTWEDASGETRTIPLPNEDFEQYFTQFDEVGNLFNETLNGLQDLDVPSGFMNNEQKQQSSQHQRGHSRKISGTAIFGFADHTRELSLTGLNGELFKPSKASVDLGKSISPGELLKSMEKESSWTVNVPREGYEVAQPFTLREEDEEEEENEESKGTSSGNNKEDKDYISTAPNPRSYKFPPSPSPSKSNSSSVMNLSHNGSKFAPVNNFSAKYLQDLKFSRGKENDEPISYVNDIGPLLGEDPTHGIENTRTNLENNTATNEPSSHTSYQYKYVAIPVQEPTGFVRNPPPTLAGQTFPQGTNILPPPSPPTLSNGSPEFQSSPEPQSPSPIKSSNYFMNKYSSPAQRSMFTKPQFFSEPETDSAVNNFNYQLQSSPVYATPSLSSSPLKYCDNEAKNGLINDESVDANATITQITPLKNQFTSTPSKNNVTLEWSPIISPNEKASKDVKKHIQQSTLRRKVKKTSLLPPGELDRYWEGPDEDKIFTCTYRNCGKKFTRRYNVRSHIQTHLSDRPFACSYCPKRFVRQHDLNRHVKGHLDARYCKCPCGKEFARLDAMKKHRERNICVGGTASTTNNCITKAPKKSKVEVLDNIKSDKLTEQLSLQDDGYATTE